jgi:hypothetical protein
MGRLARSPDLHPVGLPWHWNPNFTCGDCYFRKLMPEGDPGDPRHRNRSRCRYPRTTAPGVTYGPQIDILTYWKACIAHKPKEG